MNSSIEAQIVKLEERLKLAILRSDVNALNKLLAPELIFTNHLGQVLTKQDDLDAHKSGTLKVDVLSASEEHIQLVGDVAIVAARVRILGSYAGISSDADFRFTRIWAPTFNDTWHVVAAHSSIVA